MVRRVLVDTSAVIALLDGDDHRHGAVVAAFAACRDDELVTHGYVVAETLAVVRRRFGVNGVTTLIDEVLPAIRVLSVEPALHDKALQAYRASLPSGTSFVDQVSLAVATQSAIGVLLAVDADLARPGIELLPAPI